MPSNAIVFRLLPSKLKRETGETLSKSWNRFDQ